MESKIDAVNNPDIELNKIMVNHSHWQWRDMANHEEDATKIN